MGKEIKKLNDLEEKEVSGGKANPKVMERESKCIVCGKKIIQRNFWRSPMKSDWYCGECWADFVKKNMPEMIEIYNRNHDQKTQMDK